MTSESPAPEIDTQRKKFLKHFGTFDPRIRFPVPYIGFSGKPSSQIFEDGWHYDAMGYRNDVAVGARPPTETTRIFIVGDSTLVDGLDTADTIPGRVQAVLRQTVGAGAHVYNFGAISSCLNQSIMLVTMRLIDFDPDAIVIIAGGTDVFQPWTFDPRPGQPYNQFAIEALHDHLFSAAEHTHNTSTLDEQSILEILFSRQHNLRVLTRWKEAPWEWEVVRAFELSLDRIGRLSKGIGIPIHLALQPMVVRKPSLTEDERSFASVDFLEYLDRQYERLKIVVNNQKHKFDPNQSFIVHDLSDIFWNEKQTIFTDIVHYNQSGRQIVAEKIAEYLRMSLSTN